MYLRLCGALGCALGGEGRPSLAAARASPGASKVVTGMPNVRPSKALVEPPREWPANHTVDWG